MARKVLSPAQLEITQAIRPHLSAAVLIACSGGPDSTALALGAAHVAKKIGVNVRVGIIDHGIQEITEQIAQETAERLAARGIECEIKRVVVGSGPSMEAQAREARYAGLLEMAAGDPILLGHTLDDQAETVLLGLARGSGTRSLAGMAPVSKRAGSELRRPLLSIRRATTVRACADWGIETWSDPQNMQTEFTRVNIRRHVLPFLDEKLGPGIPEALARTSDLARADADLLDSLAAELRAQAAEGETLAVATLQAAPVALATRVLLNWLRDAGAEPGHSHIQEVRTLIDDWHGQKGIDIPGGIRVIRKGKKLALAERP